MEKKIITSKQILNTALQLAENSSWSELRLREITDYLEITLEDLHHHFTQKDDIAEAWFDRADKAMLAASHNPDFLQQSFKARLEVLICTWLDVLSLHRKVTAEMLQYKFLPLHVHLQLQGLTRISRTMQWLCEAAQLTSGDSGTRRELEEVGITGIYLVTLFNWFRDESENYAKTRALLRRHLDRAEKLSNWLSAPPSPS